MGRFNTSYLKCALIVVHSPLGLRNMGFALIIKEKRQLQPKDNMAKAAEMSPKLK